MAVFNSTKKKFKKQWEDGKTYFNYINVETQTVLNSGSEDYILNSNYKELEFYTEAQTKYFDKQLTWVWFKCHLSQECCKNIIEQSDLNNIVQYYAIKTHDMDDSEPHTHLLIKFYRNQRVNKLVDYFHADSVADCSNSIKARWNYLIHNSETCRKEKKYQYDIKDILTNDFNFFDNLTDVQQEDTIAINVVNDILNGCSERELIIKYGRDYVIHRTHYMTCANAVMFEESYNIKPIAYHDSLMLARCKERTAETIEELKEQEFQQRLREIEEKNKNL